MRKAHQAAPREMPRASGATGAGVAAPAGAHAPRVIRTAQHLPDDFNVMDNAKFGSSAVDQALSHFTVDSNGTLRPNKTRWCWKEARSIRTQPDAR